MENEIYVSECSEAGIKAYRLSGAHCGSSARCGSEEGPARAIWWVYSQSRWVSFDGRCGCKLPCVW